MSQMSQMSSTYLFYNYFQLFFVSQATWKMSLWFRGSEIALRQRKTETRQFACMNIQHRTHLAAALPRSVGAGTRLSLQITGLAVWSGHAALTPGALWEQRASVIGGKAGAEEPAECVLGFMLHQAGGAEK